MPEFAKIINTLSLNILSLLPRNDSQIDYIKISKLEEYRKNDFLSKSFHKLFEENHFIDGKEERGTYKVDKFIAFHSYKETKFYKELYEKTYDKL